MTMDLGFKLWEKLCFSFFELDMYVDRLQRQLDEKDQIIAEKDQEIQRLSVALKDQKAEVAARSVIVQEGSAADDLLKCNKELIKKNESLQKLNSELSKGLKSPVPPDKSKNGR